MIVLRNLHVAHTLGRTTKQTKYLEIKMRSTSEKLRRVWRGKVCLS
jgi:hypothetical protein